LKLNQCYRDEKIRRLGEKLFKSMSTSDLFEQDFLELGTFSLNQTGSKNGNVVEGPSSAV